MASIGGGWPGADLAIAGRKTVIDLLIRRFACIAGECPGRTFVEQVEGLTEPFARRTVALRRVLERIVLALAGRPAAQLTKHPALPASPNSLLRLVRRLPEKSFVTAPRVLGVDDFATKKGHVYTAFLAALRSGYPTISGP